MRELQVSLRQVRLTIAIPAYDGKIPCDQAMAILQAHHKLQAMGAAVTLRFAKGCSLVPVARNMLAHEFLNDGDAEQTHLLFLDSDVLFDPDDLVRLVAMATFKDVVAGIYPAKQIAPPTFYAVPVEGAGGTLNQCRDTGLIEHKRVPTGFMCIRRRVLSDLIDAHPESAYTPRHGPHAGRTLHHLFPLHLSDGELWGEDMAFCDRWRDLGGKIWVDPTIKLGHVGSFTFDHSYLAYLKGGVDATDDN